jgi:hypothetical protein
METISFSDQKRGKTPYQKSYTQTTIDALMIKDPKTQIKLTFDAINNSLATDDLIDCRSPPVMVLYFPKMQISFYCI